ncbi:membrane protein involved in the export of O-antigen and teichoic acid [Aequorivita sublithincola DSM 14238]|uniref:Membrane protein involved in the export of O-antigen and teichoic acid n=1 Tax=Aequorivita sublithincola (strain DSM 14238 / LMG 21431 / ACAM 643 / 9-3) TaxID=746697 RepID=I3YU16_AEQSU|nr:oligosaccharide flippase family protein [Aequorivita sublithincola]AFL80484.1 membrane protein involved in the export of O-antigen and teichoic acid [Aequorivita sublithincola DSM 14238]
MSVFKKLFKQTFIYGLATILPRILAVILVPLYTTVMLPEEYGIYSTLMAYLILGNVLLSYGMETAFFRFVTKDSLQQKIVQSTTITSLTVSTLIFLGITLLFTNYIAEVSEFRPEYVTYGLLILALDALVVLPFVWFRVNEKPMRYAVVKILNVVINLAFNLFFLLLLPKLAETSSYWNSFWFPENKVAYIFIANLIASAVTLLMLLPLYVKIGFGFSKTIWKQMMKYALPVLIAGIAFSINEAFDRILLKYLLPENVAEVQVGLYSACYKLGMFMTLFVMAFRLGIEPFFFNHSDHANAKNTYATITKYFTLFGCLILLVVVVYIDVFKRILIPNSQYWEALKIVPLILLANLFLGIYHNLSVWYKVTDRTKYGAYISVFAAIVTLVLNFVLIPMIGYMGSAIATLAAYGSMMVLSYLYGRKYYDVPYEVKKISGYLLMAIGFSAISYYAFEGNIWIGTALLVVFIGIMFYSEKNEFLKILKK